MRKVLLLALIAATLLLGESPLLADECMEGNCQDGTGSGFTEEGKIYTGEWKNGLPHGTGTLFISKGKTVEGLWERGKLIKEEEPASR